MTIAECKHKHRTEQGRLWCLIEREMDAKYAEGLPTWKSQGTREQWLSVPFLRNFWGQLAYWVLLRDGSKCTECGLAYSENKIPFEVHHIIPRCEGGTDHPENLKTLCGVCHRKETNHLLNNRSAYKVGQSRLCLEASS